MAKSLQRISKALGIAFNFPHSSFPVNSLRPLRGTYFASSEGRLVEYITAVFESYWASGVDISDQNALGEIAESIGLDRERFLHSIEDETAKLRLKEDTQRALQRGVFGAPTYFVDGGCLGVARSPVVPGRATGRREQSAIIGTNGGL